MKVIQTNNRTWCFVGVPEDAREIQIIANEFCYESPFRGHLWNSEYHPLPAGTWSIFADTQTITEEQAAQVVERDEVGVFYKCYDEVNDDGYKVLSTTNWRKSFSSLLRAHSLHGRQIILELLNN